jgi:predicted nucleotidyltransferase
MLYQKIIEKLNDEQVEYLVAGGIAVNLHGYIRATMDLDVFMMLDDVNTGKFIKIVKELGYKPKVPVTIDDFSDPAKRREWINKKNMVVFSVYNPDDDMEHVDILLEDKIDFHKAYKRREIIKSGGLTINLISLDDLIRLKEIAGRERDKIDIKALQKIKELRNEKQNK